MSRHVADAQVCGRQMAAGGLPALLCDRCDGRCPACDSYVAPTAPAALCVACSHAVATRPVCCICTAPLRVSPRDLASAAHAQTIPQCSVGGTQSTAAGQGLVVAQYCRACVLLGRDRDGCPRVLEAGAARADARFERRKRDRDTLLVRDPI